METIYIGRYDLLSEDFPGFDEELHGLHNASREAVEAEVKRQKALFPEPPEDCMDSYHYPGALIGEYTPKEFEATILEDIDESFNTSEYWIKIF